MCPLHSWVGVGELVEALVAQMAEWGAQSRPASPFDRARLVFPLSPSPRVWGGCIKQGGVGVGVVHPSFTTGRHRREWGCFLLLRGVVVEEGHLSQHLRGVLVVLAASLLRLLWEQLG